MSKERYRFKCPSCNKEFFAAKSIGQELGILDAGHGRCPNCEEFLNLTFNPETNEMDATKWDEYIKRREATNE